jgi:hypothetical protein
MDDCLRDRKVPRWINKDFHRFVNGGKINWMKE